MRLRAKAIVSNSDMIKNYKACREKAEELGTIFVLKNNQPDAVLFSIAEYERLSGLIEYIDSLEAEDANRVMEALPKEGQKKKNLIGHLINEEA